MKKQFSVIIFLLFSFTLLSARLAVTASAIKGKVMYRRQNAKFKILKAKVKLRAGNEVKTAKNASCQLNFPNSNVYVKPNSKFIISEVRQHKAEKPKPAIIAFFGRFLNKTKKDKKSEMTMYTPTSVAGVRGTEFETIVGESGKTRINVKSGLVNARSGGSETNLTQNKEVTTDHGQKELMTQNSNPGFDENNFLTASTEDLKIKGPEILNAVAAKLKELEETVKSLQLQQAKNQKKREEFKNAAIKTKGSPEAQELMKKYHDLNTDNVLLSKQIMHIALRAKTLDEIVKKIVTVNKLNKAETTKATEAEKSFAYIYNAGYPKKQTDATKSGCCLFNLWK